MPNWTQLIPNRAIREPICIWTTPTPLLSYKQTISPQECRDFGTATTGPPSVRAAPFKAKTTTAWITTSVWPQPWRTPRTSSRSRSPMTSSLSGRLVPTLATVRCRRAAVGATAPLRRFRRHHRRRWQPLLKRTAACPNSFWSTWSTCPSSTWSHHK